jgi:uncharacterized protein (DUF305 family)
MFALEAEDRRGEDMHPRSMLTVAAAVVVLGGHALTHQTGTADAQHTRRHDHGGAAADADFASALAAAMDKMHREMMAPRATGHADVDFLVTMIPHHAGAVEMARLVLLHGKDPLVRRLAEEIIAGQQAEITAMHARLAILRQGEDQRPDGYPTLGGTRGSLTDPLCEHHDGGARAK